MTSEIAKRPLPYLAIIAAHIIWGINTVVVKITLQEIPPMSLAFLRFALASLLLAPFLIHASKKIKIKKEDLPKLVSIGVFAIALNISLGFQGIMRTTAINASVLSLVIPILSVLGGWWFLKEKVYLVNILGIAVGLLGTLVIIGLPQLLTGGISNQILFGNILIVLGATSWVIGAIISKKILKRYSTLTVTAIGFMVGTIALFIPALIEYIKDPTWITQVTLVGLLGLLFITMLSSISGYFLFEWGLSKTSVIAADLFQYIEPLIATTLAVIVLNERISPSFLSGAVLIAVGAFLGTLAKEAHHRHRSHRL